MLSNSVIWMAQVIKKFQEMLRDMWFKRNKKLHNKDHSEHNKRKNTDLNKKVYIYNAMITKLSLNLVQRDFTDRCSSSLKSNEGTVVKRPNYELFRRVRNSRR